MTLRYNPEYDRLTIEFEDNREEYHRLLFNPEYGMDHSKTVRVRNKMNDIIGRLQNTLEYIEDER